MEFKKAIKRIVALGTGASMVGATLFGAIAADLADYPSQYIKDGKFTGVLVVGDTAAAEDVIGVSDIAVSLQFAATKPVSVTGAAAVSAEGDAWKVGTSTKMLEISENNIETLRNVSTRIGDAELDALGSGTVSNSKGDAPYNQYLYLLGPDAETGLDTGYVVFAEEDENDVTADFLYFKSGEQIGRYMLDFSTALESDVDNSAGTATTTGTYLTDFEDTEITMLGRTYTIVQARRQTGNAQIKLILMGGAVHDTLLEGNTKTYTIDGTDYEVTLDFVDSNSAKFTVNGDASRDLLDGETDKVAGVTLGVSEILYQSYAGGVHTATFFLGAQKMELRDTNVSDGVGYTNALKVDDNTIDNAYVSIEGTDDDSTFKIERISINMTADDDFYVPVGGKLSELSDLDEPEVLFTQNWDIEYRGLSDQPIETIELDTSGSSKYKLKFLDGNGDSVSMPLIEATSASTHVFGENSKYLITTENTSVTRNDYFILTDESDNRGERKTYILQYKGADKSTADSPKLKFKNLGSGDTIEQTYKNESLTSIVGPAGNQVTELATLKLGGADYKIWANAGIKASNDFDIVVDFNGQSDVETTVKTTNITTSYGMEIGLDNSSAGSVLVVFKTPDNVREGSNALDTIESLQATDWAVNVSADSNTKVTLTKSAAGETAGSATVLSTVSPDDEDNVDYAYTSYGTYIKYDTPSGSPATIKIEYPQAQREALVYITSKGVTFTTTAATTEGAVSIQRISVGATKLASEIPNIKAVNSILVGGPCANAASATIMGNPADCTEGFTPGVGKINLYENNGNVAMLVAGYAAADTRNAAVVIANYEDYAATLKGAAVEVTKVNNVLTVAEPAPVVVEEEPEVPAAE